MADLVSTGVAAKALGIHRKTLHGWWVAGHVTPTYITVGGQARWDIEDLRRQIFDWRRKQTEDED